MKTLITVLFLLSFTVSAAPYYVPTNGIDGATGPQGAPGLNALYMPEINLQFSGEELEIAGGASTNFDNIGAYAVGVGAPLFKSTHMYGQVKSNGTNTEAYTGITWKPGWKW